MRSSEGLVTRIRPYFAPPASGTRAIKIVFFAEMALSPIVAGIAYLVSAAAHGEVFKYVSAIFWFVIFVQCVFTFRWRGLWFLLGPPARQPSRSRHFLSRLPRCH